MKTNFWTDSNSRQFQAVNLKNYNYWPRQAKTEPEEVIQKNLSFKYLPIELLLKLPLVLLCIQAPPALWLLLHK